MRKSQLRIHGRVVSTSLALCLAAPVFAQQPGGTDVIWQDRGNAATLDIAGGPGGTERGPGTDFRFIKEIALWKPRPLHSNR